VGVEEGPREGEEGSALNRHFPKGHDTNLLISCECEVGGSIGIEAEEEAEEEVEG